MSLLDLNSVDIKLYYSILEKDGINKVVIYDDKKAEEIIKDEKNEKEIFILNTKWQIVSWGLNNAISKRAYSKVDDMGRVLFDHIAYRDEVVKSCLKWWDIKDDNNNVVPVTPDKIDKLPSEIVAKLFDKYEKMTSYTEDEMGN